ncbi:MAG: hypothetical protein J7K40_03495 [candidate division Zixibacteria bacterium]|nr:hypothetical protein [candidate division Zixibacteria bacterium]
MKLAEMMKQRQKRIAIENQEKLECLSAYLKRSLDNEINRQISLISLQTLMPRQKVENYYKSIIIEHISQGNHSKKMAESSYQFS